MKRRASADLFTFLSLHLPRQEAGSLSPQGTGMWMWTKPPAEMLEQTPSEAMTTVNLSSKELPSTSAQDPSPRHSWTD